MESYPASQPQNLDPVTLACPGEVVVSEWDTISQLATGTKSSIAVEDDQHVMLCSGTAITNATREPCHKTMSGAVERETHTHTKTF